MAYNGQLFSRSKLGFSCSISTGNWLSSMGGAACLKQGGNAFDAAVVAGLILSVVEPHECTLGGELVGLFKPSNQVEPIVLCGQGTHPRYASIEAYWARGLNEVPGTGLLAATVPGSFGAWLSLLRDFGTWSLQDAMAPAIHYALNGFPAYYSFVRALLANRAALKSLPEARRLYMQTDRMPAIGSCIKNLALAEAMSRIVSISTQSDGDREQIICRGIDTFYKGFVAEQVHEFCQSYPGTPESNDYKPFIDGNDFESWSCTYESAASVETPIGKIYKPKFWSQGPVLLETLKILQAYGMYKSPLKEARDLHAVIEALKLSFADREAWYGDSTVNDLDVLLSSEYANSRCRLILDHANSDFIAGSIHGISPININSLISHSSESEVGHDTSYIGVIDAQGNIVSVSFSGGWFEGSPIVPALGFALNTRAQMSWLKNVSPSRVVAHRRPRTTLSPTIWRKPDAGYLAFGGRGADKLDQVTLQFMLRYSSGNNMQNALDGLPFHIEHLPSSSYPRKAKRNRVVIQKGFGPETLHQLRAFGHDLELMPADWFPFLACVRSDGGLREAATSSRQTSALALAF